MTTSIKWNGEEVQNPLLRGLIEIGLFILNGIIMVSMMIFSVLLMLFSMLLPVFMMLLIGFVIFVLILLSPILLPTHLILRKQGRYGFIKYTKKHKLKLRFTAKAFRKRPIKLQELPPPPPHPQGW